MKPPFPVKVPGRRYDIDIKEDDLFFYGETWEEGNKKDIFITEWMTAKGRMYKTKENFTVIEPVTLQDILAIRRRWLETLSPSEVKKQVERLQKEGYNLYGETYNDLTGEKK